MAKKKTRSPLSEFQLEILNIAWDQEHCTVADVLAVLQKRRKITRNTVHTMMMRLKGNGWLKHRKGKFGFVYTPTVSREQAQQESVAKMVDTVFSGSAEGLVLTLLSSGSLSKEESARIRALIEQAKGKK